MRQAASWPGCCPAHSPSDDVVVLALPRGGVPVAFEIARALGAPLDVFLVRKLGTPGHPELAMGAIASGGIRVLNDEVVQALDIPPHLIDAVAEREQSELERRESVYRHGRPLPVAAKPHGRSRRRRPGDGIDDEGGGSGGETAGAGARHRRRAGRRSGDVPRPSRRLRTR